MTYITIFILLISLPAFSADPITVHDCGSTTATVLSVDVTPCVKRGPACILKKGTNPVVSITFTPKSAVTSVTSSVHGIIAGAKVPFPLPNPNACTDCGYTCPLTASTPVTYKVDLPIKPIYPDLGLIVQWELIDEQRKDLVCLQFPVVITG